MERGVNGARREVARQRAPAAEDIEEGDGVGAVELLLLVRLVRLERQLSSNLPTPTPLSTIAARAAWGGGQATKRGPWAARVQGKVRGGGSRQAWASPQLPPKTLLKQHHPTERLAP
jgi:hypothetical protein